jgi:hypothetical protein
MESGFSALKGRKALARGAALGTSDLRFAPSPRREVVRSGEPASRAGESGGSVGVSPGAPELNHLLCPSSGAGFARQERGSATVSIASHSPATCN